MISFEQWYELARLTFKGDKGREIAAELFVKLFPDLHYYLVGKRKYPFHKRNYNIHALAMLYNSGLVDISKNYITTLSFPGIDVDFQVIEINVPGISNIRIVIDTYFDTNDTRENGETMANGHIGGWESETTLSLDSSE